MPENEKKRRIDFGHDMQKPAITSVKSSPGKKTVIFVDWDDTLLCSSFLYGRGLRLDSEISPTDAIKQELKELELCVIQLLRMARTFGDVHVVTNAETGWVQMSAKKFIPGVLPMLERVTVLSARSAYERMFPESPLQWKYLAFYEKLSVHFPDADDSMKNIISFGDSHVEREAVRAVTRCLTNTKTKSVKFTEKPSMEQLRRQIELVTNCFQYIHSHDGDLDLQLTVTKTQPQAQAATPAARAAAPPTPTKQVPVSS